MAEAGYIPSMNAHTVPPAASAPPPEFEPHPVDEATFFSVLGDVERILQDAEIGYALCGGVASAALGRARWTKDIDIFVKPDDGLRVLDVLGEAGFETHVTNPHWLYKAMRDGVLVDVLFRTKGDLFYDEDMAERSRTVEFRGRPILVIGPEDLVVVKAVVHDEESPRHWFDALGVLAAQEMDWEYLLKRARLGGPRRVLSLLIYAQSIDVPVPDSAIHGLATTAFPGDGFVSASPSGERASGRA